MLAVYLAAPSDINGNPRRCYLVYNLAQELIDVVDEGYENAITHAYEGIKITDRIKVSASEYARWIAIGNKLPE